MTPRLTNKAQKEIEDSFKNKDEAFELLDLISFEFKSDPMSVQCFDKRIVNRVNICVQRHKKFKSTVWGNNGGE